MLSSQHALNVIWMFMWENLMDPKVNNLIVELDPTIVKCNDCKKVIDIEEDAHTRMDAGGCLCLDCYEKVFMGYKVVNPKPVKYKFIYNLKCQI